MLIRLLPFLLALSLMTACGYIGDPLPPLANIPRTISGLSVVERGSELVVQFAVPALTTEEMPIKPPLDLDIRVGPVGNSFDEATWASSAVKVYEGSAPNGTASYNTPAQEWVGKDVAIGVRAIGSNGKVSGWSFLRTAVVPPLPVPRDLRAANTAGGVRISWNGPGSAFRVFRRTGNGEFMAIGETMQPSWTDETSKFTEQYGYKVQALQKLGENRDAESEISGEVRIVPVDVFPPAVPSGVRAVVSPNSIELSWNNNPEADFASYRLYRSTNGGSFEKIAEIEIPAYSDKDVSPGRTYRYELSSVDRLGNESARAAAVEGRLQ